MNGQPEECDEQRPLTKRFRQNKRRRRHGGHRRCTTGHSRRRQLPSTRWIRASVSSGQDRMMNSRPSSRIRSPIWRPSPCVRTPVSTATTRRSRWTWARSQSRRAIGRICGDRPMSREMKWWDRVGAAPVATLPRPEAQNWSLTHPHPERTAANQAEMRSSATT